MYARTYIEHVLEREGWLGVQMKLESFTTISLIQSERNPIPQSLTGTLGTLLTGPQRVDDVGGGEARQAALHVNVEFAV